MAIHLILKKCVIIETFRAIASSKKEDWYIIYFGNERQAPDDGLTLQSLQDELEILHANKNNDKNKQNDDEKRMKKNKD